MQQTNNLPIEEKGASHREALYSLLKLNKRERQVLEALVYEGNSSVKALGIHLGIPHSTIYRISSGLEEKGLITVYNRYTVMPCRPLINSKGLAPEDILEFKININGHATAILE